MHHMGITAASLSNWSTSPQSYTTIMTTMILIMLRAMIMTMIITIMTVYSTCRSQEASLCWYLNPEGKDHPERTCRRSNTRKRMQLLLPLSEKSFNIPRTHSKRRVGWEFLRILLTSVWGVCASGMVTKSRTLPIHPPRTYY